MSHGLLRMCGHMLIIMAVLAGLCTTVLFFVEGVEPAAMATPAVLSLGCAIASVLFYRHSDEAGRQIRELKDESVEEMLLGAPINEYHGDLMTPEELDELTEIANRHRRGE